MRLASIIRDRNSPQKHVWRARIIVLTADGEGTTAVTRAVGKGKTVGWRWQERFMRKGVEGLTRDRAAPRAFRPCPPRPSIARCRPIRPRPTRRLIGARRRCPRRRGPAPLGAAHLDGHGLQPHRARAFKLSNDPRFAEKLKDVVGLYVDPPAQAVVLDNDQKSQIQALDRTQPGLPMKKGRFATMTHDYKRNGTTTLFAALDILEGKVIGAE